MSHRKTGKRRNDVAVYAPWGSEFYATSDPVSGWWGGGGAAFQASELARGLAARDVRVAHIVYPVKRPMELDPNLELVEREHERAGGLLKGLRGFATIWSALARADAAVCILRGFGLHLIVGAVFAASRRRKLVFSGSSDMDFDLRSRGLGSTKALVYRLAIRSADGVVAQTEQQRSLAARILSPGSTLLRIPSYAMPAEPAEDAGREAFLWAGRVMNYKRPLAYVNLAKAVPEARFWMVCMETADADRDLLAAVRSRAADLPNLELLPVQPPDRMLELIGRSVAVVSTSDAEGMPNVFLEAWARGVPALTLSFDPDGIVESEGLGVAAGGSQERFAEGARSLWGDAGLRAGVGENALRYVRRVHSPDGVSAEWRELVFDLGA